MPHASAAAVAFDVDEVAAESHPIDRNATRIWFAFYPLDFFLTFQAAPDPASAVRVMGLMGRWLLADQVDTSHRFFYAHRYWPPIKAAVAETFAQTGAWPTNNASVGLTGTKSGKYVSQVAITNGTIQITFSSTSPQIANANINSQILGLRPTVSPNGDVIWNCGYKGTIGSDPSSGAAGTNGTTVTAKYLPAACRS